MSQREVRMRDTARCFQSVLLAVIGTVLSATPASAAELMPPAQQNALVHKYCAVCHTDAAKNGGLSLEHFDVAQAPPSLTAMLLSKLTSGVLLKTVQESTSNPTAAAFVNQKMKAGAMSAAGIPIPDKPIIDALIYALAVESEGATEWAIERSKDSPLLTASVLRELPSVKNPNDAESYRLIASCNPATREGYLQLTWSPVPRSGSLAAFADGNPPVTYRVEGSERMGNGSPLVLHGPATVLLAETKAGAPPTALPFPAESLTIRDLFPGDTVEFSLATLHKDARRELNSCFAGGGTLKSLASR